MSSPISALRPRRSVKLAYTPTSPKARLTARKGTSTRLPFVLVVHGQSLTVTLDNRGQHTLSWSEPLALGGSTLPAGTACLYKYPILTENVPPSWRHSRDRVDCDGSRDNQAPDSVPSAKRRPQTLLRQKTAWPGFLSYVHERGLSMRTAFDAHGQQFGFSKHFLDTAEDANGAWHPDVLHPLELDGIRARCMCMHARMYACVHLHVCMHICI